MERADVREPASPTSSRGRTVRHPSPKEYVRIAVVLAVITAIEVGIYYAEISRALLIPVLLILAVIKFVLVVLWYMHLRFDSRTYARFFMIGLAGAVTLFLLVLLMFRTFSG